MGNFKIVHRVVIFTGQKPRTVKQAMTLTLEKYKYVIKVVEKGVPLLSLGGASACGLCMRFIADSCKGCPVAKATGEVYCRSTPYRDIVFILCSVDKSELLPAVKAEYKFLKRLKVR